MYKLLILETDRLYEVLRIFSDPGSSRTEGHNGQYEKKIYESQQNLFQRGEISGGGIMTANPQSHITRGKWRPHKRTGKWFVLVFTGKPISKQ